MKRRALFLWWLCSTAVFFALSILVRAVVRQPPFTDWVFIIGYSVMAPAVLIGILRLMAFLRGG